MAIEICAQLSKNQSLNVILIYLENLNYYENQTQNLNVKLIESSVTPSITSKNKIQISELKDFIENFKPDIIHTHLFKAEIISRFCLNYQAKWFTHIHDNMVQLEYWSWKNIFNKSKITNSFEKRLLFHLYNKNGGTHFIAISKHTESYIKSVQSKYSVTLLHNAIDVKRFQKPADFLIGNENSELRSVIDKRSLTLKIINIGSFLQKKNQTFILEIILELNHQGVNTTCIFLGDGPYKEAVEKRASEMGISEQCQFLGNVENVEEYLWQSDVYVHTATYEPLGLVLLEAMAAGLPVVTLDGGGNRDIMKNSKTGFLIEKQDPKEFTERILEVYQNKEISDFNAEFAKQFDIESYCDKLLTLYKHTKEKSITY